MCELETNDKEVRMNYFVSMGTLYEHGIGVIKDVNEAVRYYRRAADLGSSKAFGKLGYAYEHGEGVEKDLELALDYYEKGVDAEDIFSYIHLGDIFWDGNDMIASDPYEASEYYLKALRLSKELNDVWNAPDIYARIARCLNLGIGTSLDKDGAIRFYNHAKDAYYLRIDQGDLTSIDYLEECDAAIALIEKESGPFDILEENFYQA